MNVVDHDLLQGVSSVPIAPSAASTTGSGGLHSMCGQRYVGTISGVRMNSDNTQQFTACLMDNQHAVFVTSQQSCLTAWSATRTALAL
jgi:hypothetical protein